jgi:hypothetical protein
VQLWDVATGRQIGKPLTSDTGPAQSHSLAAVPGDSTLSDPRHVLLDCGVKSGPNAVLARLTVCLGMQVAAVVFSGLVFFSQDWVCGRPGVSPDSGDLPAYFQSHRSTGELELIVLQLF